MRHLRLTVHNLRVKCPYGEGYGIDGSVELRDCFMDSATPGTQCSKVSLGRCDQVKRFNAVWGWRSHYVWPNQVTLHIPSPVRIFFAPINREGTQWMAINAMTGERQEVAMTEPEPYDGTIVYNLYLASRRLARRTTYGAQLCEPYHGWVGGGEVIEKKMWCDCPSCVALRPREQTGKDLRSAYRNSLPPEFQVYWDRYEAMRAQAQEGVAGEKMDFINGGPAGSQRKVIMRGDPDCPNCRMKQALGGCKKHRKTSASPKDQPKPEEPTKKRKLEKARKLRDRGEPLQLARLLSKEIRRLSKEGE